jgi:2-amino-4-hydroxy-6-hydroxymethyldihydropteridine diphosphokinase
VIAVGIGGNIGGHAALVTRFRVAREALEQLGPVRSAKLYRTAPIGPVQPEFLNSAVRVDISDATADELITTVLEIERLLGRVRSTETRFGPRMIDLDILLWDDRVLRTPQLEVPHPRLSERRFALVPLVDLFGEAHVVPGTSSTLGALARRVAAQSVEEVSATW